jgi:hypothetical protein
MRRFYLVFCLVCALVTIGCSNTETETAAEKPFELSDLEALPTGLVVTHSPNPVKAKKGGGSGYGYTWQYETTVESQSGPVAIEHFGSLADSSGNWVLINFTKKLFGPKEFEEWYSCAEATIQQGSSASDPTNWGGNNCLQHSKIRWFFVGKDEAGKRVKGEAIVEQLAQVMEESE